MNFLSDGYVIQAADLVPGTFTGRFWSADRKVWENCHNANPVPGQLPRVPLQIGSVDIRVTGAAGGIKSGVRIMVFTVIDALNTTQIMPVLDKYQSASYLATWLGNTPMSAGIEWRIQQGGVIATDIVSICVGYEVAK